MATAVAKRKKRAAPGNVQAAANAHCLRTYGIAYTGGAPQRLTVRSNVVWVVPVLFTSAGYGMVGAVGVVAIDPNTLEVLDATPKAEVRSSGARLAREKRDELDAAFRRARAT